MGKTETITIVALLENDPITGVKYGEQEIIISKEEYNKYNEYSKIQKQNTNMIRVTRTKQK